MSFNERIIYYVPENNVFVTANFSRRIMPGDNDH